MMAMRIASCSLTSLATEIDGDVVETVCALDLQKRGLLRDDTVVSTVMCNLGFTKAMEAAGISVVQTQVGDKYVLNEMRKLNAVIGGEQSGHMIFLDHNSTGDGLITALQFLAACLRNDQPVSETAALMQRFPQELINVRVADKHAVSENAVVANAIAEAEAKLDGSGRILVRPSGTEPARSRDGRSGNSRRSPGLRPRDRLDHRTRTRPITIK